MLWEYRAIIAIGVLLLLIKTAPIWNLTLKMKEYERLEKEKHAIH